MHGAVPKVLPDVEEAHGKPHLEARNQEPVDGLGDQNLPGSKGRNHSVRSGHAVDQLRHERWVVSACQRAGEQRVRARHVLGYGGSVESHHTENSRERALRDANPSRPHGHVVVFHAGRLGLVGQAQEGTGGNLYYLLKDDISCDLETRR